MKEVKKNKGNTGEEKKLKKKAAANKETEKIIEIENSGDNNKEEVILDNENVKKLSEKTSDKTADSLTEGLEKDSSIADRQPKKVQFKNNNCDDDAIDQDENEDKEYNYDEIEESMLENIKRVLFRNNKK